MRMIVFFDLPNESLDEKKEYRKFRKFLIKEGFVMLQYSIYSKIVLNKTMSDLVRKRIYDNKPKSGLVQLLSITEKQFQSIEYIIGKSNSNVIQSDNRMIIL